MTRVLVGGATGHLGVRLLQSVTAAGHEAVALVRTGSAAKLEPYHDDVAEVRTGDVRDPASLTAVVAGIDTVVSTIGLTTPQRGVTPEQVDYEGNLALLRAAEAAGVQHFAYVSVAGIDLPGGGDVPVVAAKLQFEQALRRSGMGWSIVRPSGYFWNYGIFLTMAREHSVIPLIGDGEARSTPIDEGDLADAIVARLGDDGATYSAGGPADLSSNEIADMIERVLGKKLHVLHIPIPLTRAAVAAMRPFNRSEADMDKFFVWAMTADMVAEHVGTKTLETWMQAHKSETFRA